MEEGILGIDPKNLTKGVCKIFSSKPELKKKYEDRWKIDIAKECQEK